MPMKRSGRSVAEASRVMEIDDVLVPSTASGLRTGQRSVKILRLTSSFSVAVSMTRSHSPRASTVSAAWMRASAALRSSSLITFLATWRAMLPLMVAMPALMRSGATSFSSTSKPASEQTWAMPLPIWPAPITPTLRMLSFMTSVRCTTPATVARFRCSAIDVVLRRSAGSDYRGARHRLRAAELGEFLLQLRQGLEQVGDQPVIRDLEDRGFLVLVDGDDDLGILHAGQVLDGARDADRDVELRRHHFSGLADLPVVGRIAGIDRGARGTDRRAQLIGHRLDVFCEIFPALHGAAAGNDHFRRGEFGAVRLRQFLADEGRDAGIGRSRDRLDRRRAAALRRRLKGRGPHRDDFFGIARAHRLHRIAGIDQALEGV